MAQFGRALRSGRRGRRFESCHLDQRNSTDLLVGAVFLFMAGFETTSKLGEENEQRVWEKGPVDLSIAGEENPVISTNTDRTVRKDGSVFIYCEYKKDENLRRFVGAAAKLR